MGAKQGKYQGDMKNGKRDGWGICAFVDRSYYEGEWVNDQMDGKGIYVRTDGSRYEGYWSANLQNGFGRLALSNGDVYEGDFRDGKMDGYGTYFYKNGSIYDGEFLEDEAHGLGTFKGVNGEFYQGEWQVDKMHGLGVYRFVGGAKFRGEWKYGKMDGYGVYENLDRDAFMGKFEGQFLDGKMDGLGLYYWSEGDMYMGEYAQDRRHGNGIYTSVKGAVYKGQYYNGERAGWGEYANARGDVYEGQWRKNVRHGKGVVTLSEPDTAMQDLWQQSSGDHQRKWAAVWFKDSPARPQDADGAELEIDPTRTFSGEWVKGKVKEKRPYQFQDWNMIQAHVALCADNAAVAVEEAQRAVNLARRAASYSEDTARNTIAKMQAEAEHKDAYFLHLTDRADKRQVEDKHMIRFGPEVTRQTLLVMVGPNKAAELRGNMADIHWLTPVAAAVNDRHLEEHKLMSPAVASWITKAERRMRRDVSWHVTRPANAPGNAPVDGTVRALPATYSSKAIQDLSLAGKEAFNLTTMSQTPRAAGKRDQNLSNTALREAMKDVREAGVLGLQQPSKPALPSKIPMPTKPKPQMSQYVTPRKAGEPLNVVASPSRSSSHQPLLPSVHGTASTPRGSAPGGPYGIPMKPALPALRDGTMRGHEGQGKVPTPPASERAASVASSVSSRHTRMSSNSRTWAGGAPMPPPAGMLAKMQRDKEARDKARLEVPLLAHPR